MYNSFISVQKQGHSDRSFPMIKRAMPTPGKFVNLAQNSKNGNYDLKKFENPYRA